MEVVAVVILKGGALHMYSYFVGIDIAKHKHFASIVSSDGEIISDPFPFSNDIDGFRQLTSKLDSLPKQKILIGLESTAHYGENLISYLFSLGFHIGVINPIQTASLRKSNIRKTKNDKVDTFIIIKALTLNNYSLVSSRDINILKLKGLCRSRRNLVTMRSKAKIQLVSYIDQIFPELPKFFKGNIHLNVSYQLLKQFSSPNEIKELHLTKLANILHDNSHGRYGKEDAIHLKEIANNSVGICNPSICLQIKHAISQIELYDSQIDEVEELYKQIIDEMDTTILTIPGMSYNQAAVILASIGDIKRFKKSCQILAYARLRPFCNTVWQL